MIPWQKKKKKGEKTKINVPPRKTLILVSLSMHKIMVSSYIYANSLLAEL